MKTFTTQMYVNAQRGENYGSVSHHNGYNLYVHTHEDMTEYGYVQVMPVAVTFDIPDDWNPVPEEIAALEKQRTKVLAETQEKVNKINVLIGKLQALTYEAA